MNIAFIEDDQDYADVLKNLLQKHNQQSWKIHFFSNATEFLKQNISQYDVVISDHFLPDVTGKELIKRASNIASSTEFALMSGEISSITLDDDLIEDERIAAVIDKNDLEDITQWIDYFYAKRKIRRNMENEMQKASLTLNGYSFVVKEQIAIIEFHEALLTEESRRQLIEDLEKVDWNCIFYFDEEVKAPSILLGQIIYFWNLIKQLAKNGKTLFVTTHFLDEAEQCNRIALMRQPDAGKNGRKCRAKDGKGCARAGRTRQIRPLYCLFRGASAALATWRNPPSKPGGR